MYTIRTQKRGRTLNERRLFHMPDLTDYVIATLVIVLAIGAVLLYAAASKSRKTLQQPQQPQAPQQPLAPLASPSPPSHPKRDGPQKDPKPPQTIPISTPTTSVSQTSPSLVSETLPIVNQAPVQTPLLQPSSTLAPLKTNNCSIDTCGRNTCYLNVIIQSFLSIPNIGSLTKADQTFQKIVQAYEKQNQVDFFEATNGWKSYMIKHIFSDVKNKQQSVEEVMTQINNKKMMKSLFAQTAFVYKSTLRRPCEHETTSVRNHQGLVTVNFPYPDNPQHWFGAHKVGDTVSEVECRICGTRQDATYTLAAFRGHVPKVLFVWFERNDTSKVVGIQENEINGKKVKENVYAKRTDRISYPLNFEVENAKYSLVAKIAHEGPTSGGGHYTATVKRRDQWYKTDCVSDIAQEASSPPQSETDYTNVVMLTYVKT